MDLSTLREKIAQVPGNKRGRRRFPQELQREIVEAAENSGFERQRFLSEVGLTAGSFYVIRAAVKAGAKFRRLKLTAEDKPQVWEVTGPGGLRISCRSIEEVALLWRALC